MLAPAIPAAMLLIKYCSTGAGNRSRSRPRLYSSTHACFISSPPEAAAWVSSRTRIEAWRRVGVQRRVDRAQRETVREAMKRREGDRDCARMMHNCPPNACAWGQNDIDK